MKFITPNTRLYLAQFLHSLNLTDFYRSLYFLMAKRYVSKIDSRFLEAAWLRRSVINKDFYPLMSDVDMTIVLNHDKLNEFLRTQELKPFLLIRDLQIISNKFFEKWVRTGGYRNRQFSEWKSVGEAPVNLVTSENMDSEVLAFEIGIEHYLLFKQLQVKMKQSILSDSPSANFAIDKLLKEIEKTRLFWNQRDAKIPLLPREEIQIENSIIQFLKRIDLFWGELIENLHSHLKKYDWERSILSRDKLGFVLNMEMEGLPVFLLHDSKYFYQALKERPNFFVTTQNFFKLVKGIGIQEQTLLNDIADSEITRYYYDFNLQRLAHDLIGAIILAPDNYRQLYFCFYNIEMFHNQITGKSIPSWKIIEMTWNEHQKLPCESKDELIDLTLSYLDILISLS